MTFRRAAVLRRISRVGSYSLLTILLLFFLMPLYWILMTSFEGSSAFVRELRFLPRSVTFANYLELVVGGRFFILSALVRSLQAAIFTTLACILLGTLSSYAFARLKFRGSRTIFYFLIFTEMLPPISFLIPLYILFRRLRLINTIVGLIIGYTSWLLPIATWILYSYFKTIPSDLEDSSRVDGCTRIGALFKIIVPVSAPGIAAAAVVCFIFAMGEFIFALTIITKVRLHTLPLALSEFVMKFSIEYGKLSATTIIALLFPIVFAIIFKSFLIKGLTAGAVKE